MRNFDMQGNSFSKIEDGRMRPKYVVRKKGD
jgi:hypothetical protein